MTEHTSESQRDAAMAEFTTRLIAKLEQRAGRENAAFRLDLRSREFGKRGYLTLREPESSGWPSDGATTTDRIVAEKWVREKYAAYLRGPMTVAMAMDEYIQSLVKEKGEGHNTTRNRRSHVEVHIKPALGKLRFDTASLTRDVVRSFLTEVKAEVSKYGPVKKRPASQATREAIKDTMLAAWEHHNPDVAPPFAGISLRPAGNRRQQVEAIKAGVVGVGRKVTSYTDKQIERIFVAAIWYDQEVITKLANIAVRVVPNSAGAIACLVANAMRISELAYWRWSHIFPEEGATWVPGVKNESAARFAPLQLSLLPWLEWLRLQRERRGLTIAGSDFVVRAVWQQKGPLRPFGRSTIQRRCNIILALAGLKVPQKSTHIFRATHITWGTGTPDVVSKEKLQQYVGHSDPYGETTSLYVDTRPPFIPAEHRRYIELPTPGEIESKLPSFEPSVTLDVARQIARRDGELLRGE